MMHGPPKTNRSACQGAPNSKSSLKSPTNIPPTSDIQEQSVFGRKFVVVHIRKRRRRAVPR
jgi:hypothetical protein